MPHRRSHENFVNLDTWVFDLDNTLYPAESNLFAQVADKMNVFIERRFNMTPDEARTLRRDYYLEFGTTLAGLMERHQVDPDEFLAFVHDIDHSGIPMDEPLADAIAALPGKKLIYTNGSRAHAEAVAGKVGVLHLFDEIFDIKDSDYIPKPHQAAFDKFLRDHGVDPKRSAMFEDLPHNLETAHTVGMTTVLVTSSYDDHPSQGEVKAGEPLPEHVHFVTDKLSDFVAGIPVAR